MSRFEWDGYKILIQKEKREGSEVQKRLEEMEDKFSPVDVSSRESGCEDNTASFLRSGW